jgi:transcription factor IIIB subunit 2
LLLLLLQGDSHEVSLSKGRSELSAMIDHFVIRPGQDCLEASHRLYRLAVQAGFTKGRMVPQVRRWAGDGAGQVMDSSETR